MKYQVDKRLSAPLGASLVVLSSFFYASYGIWTKLMGNFFDGFTVSVFRSILVVLILGSIALYYRRLEALHWRRNGLYIVGMILASIFTWGPYYFAILTAGVGISLAINYVGLVIGMFFFGWLFAKERFTKDKIISAILGIIGLGFVFSPTVSGVGLLACIAALTSGLSSAANSVFSKKIHYNATQSTLVLWIASIIANASMVSVLGKTYPVFHWQVQWFYLFIFAIASLIASWSFVGGIKRIDAGAAGILGLLELVFGVIFGIIFFREKLTLIILVGMVIILCAAAIPYVKDFNAKRGTL